MDARNEIHEIYHSVDSLMATFSCTEDLNSRHGDSLISTALLNNPEEPSQKSNLELVTLQERLMEQAKSCNKYACEMGLAQDRSSNYA